MRKSAPVITVNVANDDGTPLDLTKHELLLSFKERGSSSAFVEHSGTDDCVEVGFDGEKSVISLALSKEDMLKIPRDGDVSITMRATLAGVTVERELGRFDAAHMPW